MIGKLLSVWSVGRGTQTSRTMIDQDIKDLFNEAEGWVDEDTIDKFIGIYGMTIYDVPQSMINRDATRAKKAKKRLRQDKFIYNAY